MLAGDQVAGGGAAGKEVRQIALGDGLAVLETEGPGQLPMNPGTPGADVSSQGIDAAGLGEVVVLLRGMIGRDLGRGAGQLADSQHLDHR